MTGFDGNAPPWRRLEPGSCGPAEIVIAGAGGFGRTVLQWLRDLGAADARLAIAGFLDDRPEVLGGFAVDVPVLGSLEGWHPAARHRHVVAVGDPAGRERVAQRLAGIGARLHTLVHPLAYVAPTAILGDGCVVGPFAFVGPGAVLGENVALHAHAFVDHDAAVGPHGFIGPHAAVGGGARVGAAVHVAAGATVGSGVEVHGGARIAPGGALK